MSIPPRSAGALGALADESLFTRRLVLPAQQFIHTAGASGRLLMLGAAIALTWANSPWSDSYADLWHHHVAIDLGFLSIDKTLHHWVNDGLMALFFFLVTLEVKREVVDGELSTRAKASLPVAAALGGMIVPALIYVGINLGGATNGWGIPMATDIAFALAALGLLARRAAPGLAIFLMTLAVVDDIGAIAVIAVFYTESVQLDALAVAGALVLVVLAAQRLGVRAIGAYWVIGIALWLATLQSGVHATVAGVVLAALTPSRPHIPLNRFAERAQPLVDLVAGAGRASHAAHEDEPESAHGTAEAALGELEALVRETESPLERLEHQIHPWSGYVVLPLFALANAGVALNGEAIGDALESAVTLGVFVGLAVGKPVGVLLFAWLSVRLGLAALPAGVGWSEIAAAGALAGIGFSVSVFITELAFPGAAEGEQAKVGILAATVGSIVAAAILLRIGARRGAVA